MDNRRRHTRKRADFQLAIATSQGERSDGHCVNISLGGALIRTDVALSVGTDLTLLVRFPQRAAEHRLDATVRWSQGPCIGVQFGALGALITYELTEFIATCPPLDNSD